jgi:hypothetical protein
MKKTYQKPVVTVVEIQATSMLMESNEGRATVQDYHWNEYSEE